MATNLLLRIALSIAAYLIFGLGVSVCIIDRERGRVTPVFTVLLCVFTLAVMWPMALIMHLTEPDSAESSDAH